MPYSKEDFLRLDDCMERVYFVSLMAVPDLPTEDLALCRVLNQFKRNAEEIIRQYGQVGIKKESTV